MLFLFVKCLLKWIFIKYHPFFAAVKYGRMTKRARDAIYQEFKNENCNNDDESGPDTPNEIDNGSFFSFNFK